MATKTPSDVHPGNLLLGANDNSISQKLEDDEFARPIARKPYEDRTNYLSRLMKPKVGPLLLSALTLAKPESALALIPATSRPPYTEPRRRSCACHGAIRSISGRQADGSCPRSSSGFSPQLLPLETLFQAWDLLQRRMLFTARK
ncbi:hypothetical protein VDGD_07999 [Verticillium dahliae]|nr:hypothetical protein VDGD_07999 [Verticillium dahliae]